jgi:membrane associated rhomboid family serine protease
MPPGSEPVPPTSTPSCYRHPGRETHLRCNRCGRYICPDCMIPASVGFQCPECVRAGNQTVRQARTSVGAILRPQSFPLVTYILIAANFVAFGFQHIVGTVGQPGFERNTLDLRLDLLSSGYLNGQPIGVADGEWYRLVTAMFLHAGLLHIGSNMISLYFIGPLTEQLLGRLRFTLVYFVGGIAGNAVSYFFMPSGGEALGASGAISAVFGCLIVVGLRKKILDPGMIVVVVVLNVVIPLRSTNIDWHAHLGGAVAGALMGVTFAFMPEIIRLLGREQAPREQNLKLLNGLQFGTMALILALSAGATALHTAHLNDPASRIRSADDAASHSRSVPVSYPQAEPGYPHWG